jgi:hypothetical protein
LADLFVDFMAENRDIGSKAAAWAAFLIFPLAMAAKTCCGRTAWVWCPER